MKTIEYPFKGHTAIIRICEDRYDLGSYQEWQTSFDKDKTCFAVDTETTGLDIFSEGFKVRTIQVGVGLEAWVIPVSELGITSEDAARILDLPHLVFQNAAYDVLAIKSFFGIQLDWDSITDTKILAHLVDSRSVKEGGPGLSLEDLTRYYISEEIADGVKSSMSTMAREIGCKKGEVFKTVDTFNETYLLYAGMDVVLTWGLYKILLPLVPKSSKGLIRFEHDVARVCAEMSEHGFLLDQDYTRSFSQELHEIQEYWEAVAYLETGCESVNSNAQVAEDLLQMGVRLNDLTPSGAYKVNKEILDPLVEQGNSLAIAVTEAKKAKKWRTSWVDTFLEAADSNGRCHASINPLQARTGRMSITGIPVQQLPSSDWRVRRCFIPEPGQVVVSCDYQAQELRVLAALSGDENMIKAFAEGADLHQMTADASGVERSVGKTVNFAYVYGSGPANIAKTCGISVGKAREVIKGFERTYPRVKALSDSLSKQAEKNGFIVTPTGRRLRVDKDRTYAALNYMIQSTSRDITAAALLRLDEEGFTPYLRLPIHDEVVASLPEEHAEWGAQRIADIMAYDMKGVHIGTDADVYGRSWGGGYCSEDEEQDYEATFKEK